MWEFFELKITIFPHAVRNFQEFQEFGKNNRSFWNSQQTLKKPRISGVSGIFQES
jgi:hypothetical protein